MQYEGYWAGFESAARPVLAEVRRTLAEAGWGVSEVQRIVVDDEEKLTFTLADQAGQEFFVDWALSNGEEQGFRPDDDGDWSVGLNLTVQDGSGTLLLDRIPDRYSAQFGVSNLTKLLQSMAEHFSATTIAAEVSRVVGPHAKMTYTDPTSTDQPLLSPGAEPNFNRLYADLLEVRQQARSGGDLLALENSLQRIQAVWSEAYDSSVGMPWHYRFDQEIMGPRTFEDVVSSTTFALCKNTSKEGRDGYGLMLLDELIERAASKVPHFQVVLLDESRLFKADGLEKEVGRVWGAYLYDENRREGEFHALYHLYSTAAGEVSAQVQAAVQSGAYRDQRPSRINRHLANLNIGLDRKFPCETGITTAPTYGQLRTFEGLRHMSEPVLTVPRAIDPSLIARLALQYTAAGDWYSAATAMTQGLAVSNGAHSVVELAEINTLIREKLTRGPVTQVGMAELTQRLKQVAEVNLQPAAGQRFKRATVDVSPDFI